MKLEDVFAEAQKDLARLDEKKVEDFPLSIYFLKHRDFYRVNVVKKGMKIIYKSRDLSKDDSMKLAEKIYDFLKTKNYKCEDIDIHNWLN